MAAQGMATTTLRAVIVGIPLDDVLSEREHINTMLRTRLDEVTERWGVKVTNVGIREITPFLIRENGGFKVAKTVNISLEGPRIVSDMKLPLSRPLETILVIEDSANPITSEAVYSEKGEGDSAFYYSGLKFRDLTFKEIKGMESYLEHFRRRDPLA